MMMKNISILKSGIMVILFLNKQKKNAGKLFFTEDTGRSGKHYGIGLSFAQGVALKHQGNLILSNPQKGGAEVILKIKK